ncbi:hypothetical protein IFM89_006433 [Coptis chinensis]|uniref:Pentatricopeptide repeat-containing protein n=1 Tax=Coptis chinensis TaxID=261450 RepID=A0A835HS62_9MAGN|nr:hypothetical protein IFM89_006433 [Coptis chinensis]
MQQWRFKFEMIRVVDQFEIAEWEPMAIIAVMFTALFTTPQHGRCSHDYLNVCGFVIDTSICKAFIDMYSKYGRIDFAREVFNRMPKRDIISWNAMIAGYGIHGRGREALLLFNDLQNEGPKLNYVTFICLLSACSHSGLVPLLA